MTKTNTIISMGCFHLAASLSFLLLVEFNAAKTERPVDQQQRQHGRCERIEIPLCKDAPYNFTHMPNLFDHPDQQTAALNLQDYNELVLRADCHVHLKFFLCSLYAPMCTETVDVVVTSCRAVCQKVEESCTPLFKKVGLPWPESLNCSKFPVAGRGTLCMDPESSLTLPESTHSGGRSGSGHQAVSFENVKQQHTLKTETISNDRAAHDEPNYPTSLCDGIDVDLFLDLDIAATDPHSGHQSCFLPCDRDWMFDQHSKTFAETWMTVWAALCYVVTCFTVLTFCMDRSRFRYPERPIIFISFCYNVYSFGYLLFRLFGGPTAVKCRKTTGGRSILISGGMENSYCVITFTILYYFSTSSAVWWVLLAFAWYLAAARKWGREAIADVSHFFHLAAWGLSALLTIAVMVTHSVDASELTGLCFVGQQNSATLLSFVLIPLALCFTLGVAFVCAGLKAMVGIRTAMKMQERSMDLLKLEKLMTRIAIFAILYGLPTFVVVCCYAYEYFYLKMWAPKFDVMCQKRHEQKLRSGHGIPIPVPTVQPAAVSIINNNYAMCGQYMYDSRPAPEVFMLKIFMSLIIGVTSGMWMVSRKTLDIWRTMTCCLNGQTPGTKFTATQPCVSVGNGNGGGCGNTTNTTLLPLTANYTTTAVVANNAVAPPVVGHGQQQRFTKNCGLLRTTCTSNHNHHGKCNRTALLQSADV